MSNHASAAPAQRKSILAYSFAASILLIAIGIVAIAVSADACTPTSYSLTSTAPTTNWSDTTKWTPSGYPGQCSGDTANIGLTGMTMNVDVALQPIQLAITTGCPVTVPSGGSLTLQTSSSATSSSSFTINGGTFGVDTGATLTWQAPITLNTGTLNVGSGATLQMSNGAQLNINGGTVTGGGTVKIPLSHAASFSGTSGAMTLDNVIFDSSGSTTFSSSTNPLAINNGAGLINESGATFSYNTSQPINTDNVSGPKINNLGTFNIAAGNSPTINVALNNNGTIALLDTSLTQTLTLAGGGAHAGTFTLNSPSIIAFNGTHNFDSGWSWSTVGNSTFELVGGTATITGSFSTPNFTQTAGTLSGTGTMTVSNTFLWQGGTQTGAGFTTLNGPGTISGTSVCTLDSGRTLSVSGGTLVYNPGAGGGLAFTNTSTLSMGGGSIDLQGDTTISADATSAFSITGGTLKKTAGTRTLVGAIVNVFGAGVVQPGAGTTIALNNGGTINGSTISLDTSAAGSTLEFAGGTTNLGSGVSITSGNFALTNSGVLSINVSNTVSTLTQSGGTLTGTQTLTTGTLNWTGGTMSSTGGGGLSIVNTGNINGSSAATLTGNWTLTNGGTVHYAPTASLAVNSGGTIQNNGTWSLENGTAMTSDFTPTFFNNGTLSKLVAGATSFGVPIKSTGPITLNNGADIELTGGGQINGSSITFNNASDILGIQTNAVTIATTPSITGPGLVRVGSTGTLINSAITTIPNYELDNGGTSSGASTLNVTTAFKATGGTMSGGGTMSIASGATADLTAMSGSLTLNIFTLNNAGTMTWNPTFPISFQGSGHFVNLPTGILNITGAGGTSTGGTSNSFDNQGTINRSGAATFFTFDLPVTNSGTMNVTAANDFIAFANGGSMTGGAMQSSIASGGYEFAGGTFNVSGGSFGTTGGLKVNGGILNINAAMTAPAGFALISGTLGGTGSLTFPSASTATASGGTILNTTVTAASGSALTFDTTASTVDINGSTVTINSGANATWTGANQLLMANGATINDAGSFTWTGGGNVATLGATPSINVSGTLTKSTSTAASGVAALLQNSGGTISSQAGALQLNYSGASAHSGTFDTASGAEIDFGGNGGTYSFTNVTNTGTGLLRFSGGTGTFNTGTTLLNFDLDQATLNGPSSILTFTGTFNWNGGTLNIPTNNSGGTLNILGTVGSMTLGANLSSGASFSSANSLSINSGITFTNPAGSTFTVSGNGGISGAGQFTNTGTLTRSVSGSNTISTGFSNAGGTVNLNAGTLIISNAGTDSGTYNSAAGTTLTFSGGTRSMVSTATIGSGFNGALQITGGTIIDSGTLTPTGAVTINGGALAYNKAAAATFNQLAMMAGTLSGNGPVQINGSSSWTGGTITGSGSFTINAGGSLTVNGTTTPILDGRTITIDGTMTLASGTSFALEMDNGAAITNSTGTFDMQNDAGIMTAAGSASFNNLSTFNKSAGLLTQPFSPSLTNSGQILLTSGTLSLLSSFAQSAGSTKLAGGNLSSGALLNFTGGQLLGSGTINAPVTNAGATIMPGTIAAPGTFTINGAFNQTSGTLITNLFANGSNGQIAAPANSAALGGNLTVQFQGGYTPASGDSFTVLTGSSVTDTSTKSYPPFGPNNTGFFTPTVTPTALTLVATIPSADMQVAPTAPASVLHNATWTVSVPVTNNGPDGASNVTVTLTPSNGTVVTTNAPPAFSCSGTAPVTCTAASFGTGTSTISVSLTATSVGTISLAASVTANESDPNTANNTASASATVQPVADLGIGVSASPNPVNAASTATFVISVTNAGPDTAAPVNVAATLSAGSISSAPGCTFTGSSIACSVASLGSTRSTSFTVTAQAPANGTSMSLAATVSSSTADTNTANNSADATLTVTPVSNLVLTNSGPATVVAGANAVYTVTLTNNGPSDASNVQILDVTPPQTSFVSNSGACTQIWPCTIASLPAGQSVTITSTYGVAPNASGAITNTAQIPSMTASSTATVTTSADLAVTKSGPSTATPNTHITYDVTVTNNGPSDAAGVVLSDPTPSRLTFVSATGACTAFPCTIGALPAGQSRTMQATYDVVSGPPVTITNTASVSASTNDPLPANNAGSAQTSTGCPSAAPANLLPANGVTGVPTDGTLHWNAAGAATYNVYLGLAGSGCNTLLATTPSTSVPYSGLQPGTQYEWRVEAVTQGCSTLSTACTAFTTAAVCPTAPPTLNAPANGITIGGPITFAWTAVAGATSYEVFAGVNGAAATSLGTTADTQLTASVNNGTITWFVVANVGPACPALPSQSGSFTVCNSAAPPVPDVVTNVASGQSFAITWPTVIGAASYQIDESTTSDFSAVTTQSVTTTSVTYQHSADLGAAIFYYRVRSVSSCGGAVSANSVTARVVITPIPKGSSSPNVNVPAGSTTPVTQIVHAPGFPGSTVFFLAQVDQPWMSVSPSSGFLPPEGLDFTITSNPTALDNGTVTGTLIVTIATPAPQNKVGANDSTNTISVPVSVSLITPVTPKPSSPGGPSPKTLIIPSVGHLDGVNSRWQSDIRVTNASTFSTKYNISFTPAADPTAVKQTTITAAPGATVALDDIVKNWFGVGTTGDTANGVLQIAPASTNSGGVSVQTVASSRTYDVTTNGTLGQYIPAIPFSSFIGAPQQNQIASFLSLQQVEQSDHYRTNLGVVEAAGQPASVVVSAFDGSGAKLFSLPLDLKANEQKQLNGFLTTQGVSSLTNGRIEVKVTGGAGKVTAYASLIDNETGDPLLISGVPANTISATNYVLPGVADLNNGVANWRSDVRIYNAGDTTQTATLTFVPQNNGGAPSTATVTLNAGEVKQLDAIVNSTFNLANVGGALHVNTPAASSLVVTGRTYNQLSDGATYGQFIPAVTDGVGNGGPTLHILQVEDSVRYRTNIGVAEVSGKPATVELSVVIPDSKVAPTATLNLGANEYRQYDVIQSLGLANVYNARVTVRVVGGDGKVTAYGSVIDMKTQDPTYVPAQQ